MLNLANYMKELTCSRSSYDRARPFLNKNWYEVRFHKLVSSEILTLKKNQQDDKAGCVHTDYSSLSQACAIRKFLLWFSYSV